MTPGSWEWLRFWGPVILLALVTAHVTNKVVQAHVNPQVRRPSYVFERPLAARRGSVYASNGHDAPLVKSVPFWEYHLDPVALTNAVVEGRVKRRGEPPRPQAAIVKTIATSLGLDYYKVKQMSLKTSARYQYLGMTSDSAVNDMLANRQLVAGVAIHDKQVRQYLNKTLLSHVLGAVNAEGVGSSGIEQRFNRILSGTPGVVRGMKDAFGHEIYDKRIVSIEPKAGSDIYLTIDQNIQYETENALKWGIAEYGAASGWAIVMDAQTGAIYAMASYPDFDPVLYGRASDEQRKNRAISFNYEPGSVLKVLTVATAIETNPSHYGPNTLYSTRRDDPNYYRLPGDGSHVWEPTMTLTHAIVHSSNIVIGKLAYDLGPKTLYDSFIKFGFGAKTGIDLPGEETGILPNPNKQMWDLASRSRAGIGQFVAVTPIQLISAYQSIANDGVRMKPYLVERIEDADGHEIYRAEPTMLSRSVSAKTAKIVREMMVGVASKEGTARRAAIRGYSVAGKTGTAQKVENGHYIPGLYRATFCGMIPSGAPEIVILASLDFEKKTKFHQGGNSAGPVFKRIALAAIRYLGIEPDRQKEIEEYENEDEFNKILDERAEGYDIIED